MAAVSRERRYPASGLARSLRTPAADHPGGCSTGNIPTSSRSKLAHFIIPLVAPFVRAIIRHSQQQVIAVTITTPARTYVVVLTALGATHLLNDLSRSSRPPIRS